MEIEKLKAIIAIAEESILHKIRQIEAHDVQVDSIDLSVCQTIGYKYLTVDNLKIRVSI